MVKTLDVKYTEIMIDKLLNIYYKSLFFKEHFDIHHNLKNIKLNDLLLNFLSRKLMNSISLNNLNMILTRYTNTQILQNIKTSIKQIFDQFNNVFSSEEYFLDLKSICNIYDTEIGCYNVNFNKNKFKQDFPFYIEKYIRIEDYDSLISEREQIYKNVVNINSFLSYIETDPLFSYMTMDQKISAFKSIKYGVRIIYYQNDIISSQNININQLRQNELYLKEKCWILFGGEENSVINFPLEVCREESNNLLNVFRDNIFEKINNQEIIDNIIQELLNSLIINKDYKHFFTNVVPFQLINLMNYAEFKKISQLFKDIYEKNSFFSIDESIFKLIKETMNYKELVK